jgi:hypothetical protein
MASRDARKIPWPLAALCLVLAIAHAGTALLSRPIHAAAPVMSPPPDAMARTAMALGDRQFLYRTLAVQLQNAGDGGGQVTPISTYNFDYVLGWLNGLQTLDPKSNHHFILAARYFSFTPSRHDLQRIVDFLVATAVRDPQRHWFWLAQAVELADHRLDDKRRALEISLQLAAYDFPGLEHWVWVFPALLYEKLGRYEEGLLFLERVRSEKDSRFTTPEKNWIDEVTQRLNSSAG